MSRRWIVLLLVVSGCTAAPSHPAAAVSSNSAAPSASATASAAVNPSPSVSATPQSVPATPPVTSTLLFAALEAKGTSDATQWNTIAIAGLDGYARAKATFTPLPRPYVGCAGAVLPQSAYAVAGKVYYSDGAGVVRSLAPGGQPVAVTSFPLTSTQQMLSFAVSPDGGQVLGTIFTLPPKPAGGGDPCAGAGTSPFATGNFSLDVYAAGAGATSHLLYHQDLGTFGGSQLQVLSFIGWDAVGPLATDQTVWASQGGGPVHYVGLPVRVDPTTGKVVKPLSDQSCFVWDIAASGDYVCVDGDGRIWVRRAAGSEVWHLPPIVTGYRYDLLSPDEGHIADLSGLVFNRDGSTIPMPNVFSGYSGWLDGTTLISGDFTKNLSYMNLGAPANVVDLGFKGAFIGTVRS
ncbi:MAG TPA: hypothetical protein VJQ08_00875 [Candidatus Dormibacteraeota bacterium]|nr:hypothetical protein [Candidatus Dormibacteraeota bacterium]